MKLRVSRIDRIYSERIPDSSELLIEAEMSQYQMFNAIGQFLSQISGETWHKWVNEINDDLL